MYGAMGHVRWVHAQTTVERRQQHVREAKRSVSTAEFSSFQRGGDSDGDGTRQIGNKVLAWIHARRLRALLQAFLPLGRYVKAGCIHDIRVWLPLATLYARSHCGIPLSEAVRAASVPSISVMSAGAPGAA